MEGEDCYQIWKEGWRDQGLPQDSMLTSPNTFGWYANLCLDMKELEHLILVTISWESFSPILPACFHAYLWCQEDQHTWPLHQLSMGDQIDEWMEEMVSAYMIAVRGVVFYHAANSGGYRGKGSMELIWPPPSPMIELQKR
ncbi:hypothetical protein F5141DRAFT_1062966 [Pisolithus sp. B1]|nr:hypothetical protein F5141DRAFT_1062966 [Pisolithus sp. B1]